MMFKKKSSASVLTEIIFGLIILMGLGDYIFDNINMGLVAKQQRIAVDHLEQVNIATGEYIKAHHVDLLATTTVNTGVTISINDLITDNLLPVGFATRNIWQHEYDIYIRQPNSGELQGIVLTKGGAMQDNHFNNAIIPSTAALLGGAGGYIPTGVIPGETSGTLMGSFRAWRITLADFGIPSSGPGHLGALATFGESELGLDFLYRIAVPGEKELNAMQTELNMTDHAIEGVKDIQFVSHTKDDIICTETSNQGRVFFDEAEGLYICRENEAVVIADTGNSSLLKYSTIASNNDIIQKPICPSGTNTQPQIFVSPSIASTGSEATRLASFQTWATSINDDEWRVHMRLLSQNSDWVYPSDNYGKIMVLTTCSEVTTP